MCRSYREFHVRAIRPTLAAALEATEGGYSRRTVPIRGDSSPTKAFRFWPHGPAMEPENWGALELRQQRPPVVPPVEGASDKAALIVS